MARVQSFPRGGVFQGMAFRGWAAVGRGSLVAGGAGLLMCALALHQLPPSGEARIELSARASGVEAGGSYAWLVRTRGGAVLIDAGLDPSAEAIRAELARRGMGPSAVRAILLTHGHRDHWGGAAQFPQARVYLGAEDMREVRG